MRLLADENIAAPLVQMLRQQGFDVGYVAELQPGLSDDGVLALAVRERRLILTEDRDFGELVFRQKRGVPGVIMTSLARARKGSLAAGCRTTAASREKTFGFLCGH